MTDRKFKVLLYSDGSQQAFSAAVYTANLLESMPNMHLTVVQVKEEEEDGVVGTEYNWIETWPASPTSEWLKRIIDGTNLSAKDIYAEILTKTDNIFIDKAKDVRHHVIYSNPSISDTVESLINYATENSIRLIIMGTRGLTTLKGLIFGCLAHNVLNSSPIPVLLVKKLPQDFIDSYCSN